MPVTLAQASVGVSNALDRRVIDEFRKSSFLLDRLTYDQAVNPTGRGASLAYSYFRTKTQRSADYRAINTEYTPTQVEKEQFTVNLKPLGGSFQIDRVIANSGGGIGLVDEVDFQMGALIQAARAFAADQFINGDTAVDADGFEGLSEILEGTPQEVDGSGTGVNLDFTVIDSQVEALVAVQKINAWLGKLDGPPDAIFGNSTALAWFSLVAGLSGQLRSQTDAFGRLQETFRDIALVDLGAKAGSNDDVIATDTGRTDLYAVRFGLDGFHAVAVTGPLVRTWLPDFTTAGAVKTGEAELGPIAPVLKATRAAAVLRDVKVA